MIATSFAEPIVPTPPVEIVVTRFVCPFCHRSWSRRPRTAAHIARCWRNPAVRNCKTCVFYSSFMGEESCFAGVDLSSGALPMYCVEWGGPR